MISFRQDCLEVYTTNGTTYKTLGYFTSKLDANKVAKGQGEWGGDAVVQPKKVDVKIFENLKEFEDDKLLTLRERALSKLTTEERKALGL